MAEINYDYMFKIIIIGESGTGKSCLLHYFLENKYKKNQNQTVGVEFGCKHLEIDSKKIKLQIWDTAGQERFRSVTKSYYRGAAAAILVYDITNLESFQKLSGWINDAKSLSRQDISMIVVGNKSDLTEARAVNFIEASQFCQENQVPLLETSAVTGENVEFAFMKVTKTIMDRLESGKIQDFKGIHAGRLASVQHTCSC